MLSGSIEEITRVAKKFRVYFSAPDESDEHYLVDHSLFTYLIDPAGEVADILGRDLTAAQIVEKIEHRVQLDVEQNREYGGNPNHEPVRAVLDTSSTTADDESATAAATSQA